MIIQDDRTQKQKLSHYWLVVGTDKFMSNYPLFKRVSYAAWACRYEDLNKVEKWVSSRSDMSRVRVVRGNYRPSRSGHCHIYVVDKNHPAIA